VSHCGQPWEVFKNELCQSKIFFPILVVILYHHCLSAATGSSVLERKKCRVGDTDLYHTWLSSTVCKYMAYHIENIVFQRQSPKPIFLRLSFSWEIGIELKLHYIKIFEDQTWDLVHIRQVLYH
jgi:hypothetical protein